ncbi:signal peptidase I [Candidatus Peregrinibacteria bacterium CG11_big_fil_rev_8_21_14_0_20_46_8]|nr:MAG: signal peptidase I [Candidatus Peregrinibacteria bacterium CG11_big_fil_rev_8_21_14_0_20_46_8]
MSFKQWADKHPNQYFVLDIAINIIVIVALVYGVRSYLISPFQVFGPSMCNTLNFIDNECQRSFGEYLIVNKAKYHLGDVARGDIVVFEPPTIAGDLHEEYYIKRIIGLPGDTVSIRDGRVFVQPADSDESIQLEEPYLNEQNRNKTLTNGAGRNKTYPPVPEGHYFVMGDNRAQSTDSRTCFEPSSRNACDDPHKYFIEKSSISGRSWFILWPFERARILRNPDYSALLEK